MTIEHKQQLVNPEDEPERTDAREKPMPTKTDEKAELAECEARYARGRGGYYDMGCALRTIRDKKLYRYHAGQYKKFEDYTEDMHRLGKSSAHRLIQIADLYEWLVPAVGAEYMPISASALGEMLGLELTLEQEIRVYKLALEKADEEVVVAANVRETLEKLELAKDKPKDSPVAQTDGAEDTNPSALPGAAGKDDGEDESHAAKGKASDSKIDMDKHAATKGGRTHGTKRTGRSKQNAGKSPNAKSSRLSKNLDKTAKASKGASAPVPVPSCLELADQLCGRVKDLADAPDARQIRDDLKKRLKEILEMLEDTEAGSDDMSMNPSADTSPLSDSEPLSGQIPAKESA